MVRDVKPRSDEAPNDRGESEPLKRRGDNVGQSGRWTRGDPGERRYGNEESRHSTEDATEHAPGAPAEPPERQPNADKPNASPYEGRFASPEEEGEERGDDKSRYDSGSYAEAGGVLGGDRRTHPDDERWQAEGGAGYGEKYGSGREAGGNGTKRPAPVRKPT
jgi:hypothetical protein